jgi:hypothetical protein
MKQTKSKSADAVYRSDYDISASEALDIVRDCISCSGIVVNDFVSDGRIGSAISEDKITAFLSKDKRVAKKLGKIGYVIHIPDIRCWFDFALINEGSDMFVPVNIKISSLKPHIPEATHARYGLLYSLLGIKIAEATKVQWDKYWDYFRSFKDRRSDKDYYFLIIDKNDPTDVFYTSMKTMRSIHPSSVNLPFQAVWLDNRERDFSRTQDEVYEFLYENMAKSMRLMERTASTGITMMDSCVLHAKRSIEKNKKSKASRRKARND